MSGGIGAEEILSAFEGGFSNTGGVIFSLQAGAQVADIPADAWTGYLPVGNHPECPSGFLTFGARFGHLAHELQRHINGNVMD
ncbi:hypothetical protein [Streptomyces sp. NPDC002676]